MHTILWNGLLNDFVGHDGLILEFRASKPWNLSTPSVDNLKTVTATLWEVMDMGGRFMDNAALHRDVLDFGTIQFFFNKF